ncbi:hypothetical protein Bho114_014110, partial [Bartonella sp. 114]
NSFGLKFFVGFLMLCMVPINDIAFGSLSPEKMKNASGLLI